MGYLRLLLLMAVILVSGCAAQRRSQTFLATGYCACGECNGYDTGSWYFLYLDRWNKRLNYGAHRGERYTGKTAGGQRLRAPQPGLLSLDTLSHPWRLPHRMLLPWHWLPQRGTIAADTDYYAFGTKMTVPGWGKGVVDDVGGAIKGPNRLDLFFPSHRKANDWGRRTVEVEIER